jgi:myo-inositol-1-phosphate synthase
VESADVTYSADHILSSYELKSTVLSEGRLRVKSERIIFQTERRVPKLGVMLVGWGGNNGTTVTAGILANKLGISWETKEGTQMPNYFGSVTQASTVKIATDEAGRNVFTAFNNVVPMVNPNDIVVGGWDISSMNLAEAMKRARVLDVDLQRKLVPHMQDLVPLPSIYYSDFIAMNQGDRADNVLPGTKADHLAEIQKNIREFKISNSLDKVECRMFSFIMLTNLLCAVQVIVLWTATTERFAAVVEGKNDTADNLLRSIQVCLIICHYAYSERN